MLMDAFISYATEDEIIASEITGILKSKGFLVWYAPLQLEVGDKLLSKINEGLNKSKSGILLISENYINKKWTKYELDILLRQSIEKEKTLYPIWHNIEKDDIEKWNPGLSGIVAVKTSEGYDQVGKKLSLALSKNCRVFGAAPSWEDPFERFLNGRGELINTNGGGCFTLWEAVLLKDSLYPIWINGKKYSKKDMAFQAAQSIPHQREVAVQWVGEEKVKEIEKVCIAFGFELLLTP